MLYYLLFFFIAFGSKLVLALVMIYLLFPTDASCNDCDGETVLLRMGPAGRTTAWLLFGRLQRRWCPQCGWEGMARARPVRRARQPAGAAALPGVDSGERAYFRNSGDADERR